MGKMINKNCLLVIFLTLLLGCGESEKSQKYIFDSNDMKKNIKKYTVSNGPMDELGCGMSSILFSKEMLNAINSNKKPDMSKMKNSTPTTIELFKDKIVWSDLGQETKINDNKVSLKGIDNKTVKLELVINENNINFRLKEKKLNCLFPFKKSN